MSKKFPEYKNNWTNKLRQRLRIVVQSEHDFQEKRQFNITPIKLISLSFAIVLFFVIITAAVISFTRLRVLIPGYADPRLREDLYNLEQKTDSLDLILNQILLYDNNIRRILLGEDSALIERTEDNISINNTNFEYRISSVDSVFRSNFEHESMYNLHDRYVDKEKSLKSFSFYPPIKGMITSQFNESLGHIGTDIIPVGSELVKSIMNGVVIFSGWTVETGNVIIISHQYNVISVYKHNSVLLNKSGDYVRAGEAIAICGNSGELTTGPHLHFELWFENRPVDAEEFINFGGEGN
ncbi:MAG: M23 family metallopeptidase [Bacteroidales bacterium]|jgi:murein DD-endopeptidase MepM/ murein hydrolase activator NlpD|nr:M23 family metallopeptidase [Bacteroidales bacterium]